MKVRTHKIEGTSPDTVNAVEPFTVSSRDLLTFIAKSISAEATLEPHHPELWVTFIHSNGKRVQVCLVVKEVQS